VHRQRLPEIARSTSSRLGCGLSRRRAVAARTNPGVQKPHCVAPWSTNACWTGDSPCGGVTPSIVVTATALLRDTPHPTREEIERAISGNLCRCTGYRKIVEAIESAAGEVP